MSRAVVLAVTWWGHASTSVEPGGVRVAFDPLLSERLAHLRRYAAAPTPAALDADVVLVSHLHRDHLHLPSLRRFAGDVPLVVPRGAEPLLRGLDPGRVLAVAPGDELEVAALRVQVLGATHDGRRDPWSRARAPAVGFRVENGGHSVWFPGDTELRADMADVAPVDLALVPVGGWGPSLGAGHLDPEQAARAVAMVGATYALPVHWGTFWPVGHRRLGRATHHHLFLNPGDRFEVALARDGGGTQVVRVAHGERVRLPG